MSNRPVFAVGRVGQASEGESFGSTRKEVESPPLRSPRVSSSKHGIKNRCIRSSKVLTAGVYGHRSWGVFAAEDIFQGEYIVEYKGESLFGTKANFL